MPNASGGVFDRGAVKGGEPGPLNGTNSPARAGIKAVPEITIDNAAALSHLMMRPFYPKQLVLAAVEERHHGVDERLRLVDIGSVACGGDHHLFPAGNFRRHVVGGSE